MFPETVRCRGPLSFSIHLSLLFMSFLGYCEYRPIGLPRMWVPLLVILIFIDRFVLTTGFDGGGPQDKWPHCHRENGTEQLWDSNYLVPLGGPPSRVAVHIRTLFLLWLLGTPHCSRSLRFAP